MCLNCRFFLLTRFTSVLLYLRTPFCLVPCAMPLFKWKTAKVKSFQHQVDLPNNDTSTHELSWTISHVQSDQTIAILQETIELDVSGIWYMYTNSITAFKCQGLSKWTLLKIVCLMFPRSAQLADPALQCMSCAINVNHRRNGDLVLLSGDTKHNALSKFKNFNPHPVFHKNRTR